jgi:hypothetical protein
LVFGDVARFGTTGNVDDSLVSVFPLLLTAALVVAPGDNDRCNIRFLRMALAYRVDVMGDAEDVVDVNDSS